MVSDVNPHPYSAEYGVEPAKKVAADGGKKKVAKGSPGRKRSPSP